MVLNEAWMAYIFGAPQFCPTSEHTAVRAGSHNGGAGKVATDPRGLLVRKDIPGTNTRRHCRERMRQNADSAEIFGVPS